MYLHRRFSRFGRNEPAYLPRVTEFAPSAATTRSYSAARAAGSGASARNRTRTPSAAQRACKMASSRLRLMAAKPCPPEVKVVPRKCTSMSSQRANSRRMAAKISTSACSMPPSVSSEKTTPKPNVSSAALRSNTMISCLGSSCLARAAKYRPPGPPPTTAIRIVPVPFRLASAYGGLTTIVKKAQYQYGQVVRPYGGLGFAAEAAGLAARLLAADDEEVAPPGDADADVEGDGDGVPSGWE